MNQNPAKYFDKILRFLATDYNRVFTFNDILEELYKNKLRGADKIQKFLGTPIEHSENSDFLNAIRFLAEEGLIRYDVSQFTISIQTAGFIKIKTKGFEKEIRDTKYSMRLSWFNNLVTPIIAFVSLIISSYLLLSGTNPNTNSYKNNKYQYEDTNKYSHD